MKKFEDYHTHNIYPYMIPKTVKSCSHQTFSENVLVLEKDKIRWHGEILYKTNDRWICKVMFEGFASHDYNEAKQQIIEFCESAINN